MIRATHEQPVSEPTTAQVFVGRQPIFDQRQNVYAYELLYRAGSTHNAFNHADGDQASRHVIDRTMNVLSLDDLVGKHRAFINVPRAMLLDQTYMVLPKDRVVIELLENVEPDAQVVQAARQLKQAGYTLALDDFEFRADYRPLLDLADIVKVDFLAYNTRRRKKVMLQYGMGDIALLAEKVETQADFKEAVELGYTYFQGYFFCKPQIIRGREIPSYKTNYLLFLQELNRSPVDYDQLEAIIKREMSLSVRLLKYLNSAAIGIRHRISSIRHGLTLMGEGPLRKWASIVAMIAMADNKPMELMTTCLVRARFCEQMAALLQREDEQLDLFMLGLFSGADALMDRPMEEVLATMPLPADVTAALLGTESPLSVVYRLALAMERGNLTLVNMYSVQLGIDAEQISAVYRQALHWTDENMPG